MIQTLFLNSFSYQSTARHDDHQTKADVFISYVFFKYTYIFLLNVYLDRRVTIETRASFSREPFEHEHTTE